MNALERLSIRQDIAELKARWFYFVDQKMWAEFESCFVADAVIDYTRSTGTWSASAAMIFESPADFAQKVASILEGATTFHQASMPIYEFMSEREVRVLWRMEDVVQRAPDDDRPSGRGYGFYQDGYRLTANGWKISSIVFTRHLRVATP